MQTKLKLNLDDLTVESFDTSRRPSKRGTVFGEQCTCYTQCTCPGCPTCDNTCRNTCAYTCDDATCAYTCDDATCPYTCDDASCGGGCATIAYTNCFRCGQSADASACNGAVCP